MAQFKIGIRLGLGYALCVILTIVTGAAGLYGNYRLVDFTEWLLVHPFAVSNALRAANGDIIEIRSMVKDIVVSPRDARNVAQMGVIAEREQDIDRQFALVRQRYLGDPADVERLLQDYNALKAVRDQVVSLAKKGDVDAIRVLSAEKAPPLYDALRADMDRILAFADAKAAGFLAEAIGLRDSIQAFIWTVLVGSVAMGFVAAWASTRGISRPLAKLEGSMLALSSGNLAVKIKGLTRKDEIGRMANAVQIFQDGMIRAEKLEHSLRQAQKMEAIGQLTGGIAHDFNNLLQVIITDLDLAMMSLDSDGAVAAYLRDAVGEVERGARLTSHLLSFARRQPLNPKPLRVERLVGDTVAMLRRTLGEQVTIELVNSGGLWPAMVDENQLQNAILNLAVNARDAMPDGGSLILELSNVVLDSAYAAEHVEVTAGQYVLLAITDTGVGMTREVAQKAFEPFFTTKPEGAGTGLGLSMVFGFVKQTGGHIKIYSEPGQGTTVKLYLPKAQAAEAAREARARDSLLGAGETILVAEDDSKVRTSVVAQLAELGYRVLAAADGEEAIEILSRGEKVDLLFTDVIMPGAMDGRALAAKAGQIVPGLRVVFTSGYTENAIIHNGRLDEGVTLLSKPYRLPQLAETIHSALARSAETVVPPEVG